MLMKLFEGDDHLKAILIACCDFRSKDIRDFEVHLQKLLGSTAQLVRPYARNYAISILIRKYYNSEKCDDTIANKDGNVYQNVLNEILCSELSMFSFLVERDLITDFKV